MRLLLHSIQVVLHGLDIANVAYKWDTAVQNARMCVTEFKAQVVAERENGLDVSGFMDIQDDFYTSDRLPNLAKMQGNNCLCVILPMLDQARNCMLHRYSLLPFFYRWFHLLVGFGTFVVKPCLEKVARHLPLFDELVETLSSNIQVSATNKQQLSACRI